MEEILITGFNDSASSDAYDEDFPTRQTEKLALSLRRMFYQLQTDGVPVYKRVETADVDTFQGIAESLGYTFDGSMDFLGEVKYSADNDDMSLLPAVPPLESVLTSILPLLPALLAGTMNPAALIPILIPYVLRFAMGKLLPGVVTGADNNLKAALEQIGTEIHTGTETTIEQYNSLCDAIYTLEELKQVVVMRTSEIDKVITSEPL